MPSVSDFIASCSTPVSDYFVAIERDAHLHTAQPQMLCGPEVGRVLELLCAALAAKLVVEVGTFVGYSSLWLARGLAEGGMVHTFEVNDELEDTIGRNLALGNATHKVTLHVGDANRELVKFLSGSMSSGNIDVAFIDAGKRDQLGYYNMLVPHMRKGGIMVIDNALWYGKVVDAGATHPDMDATIIDEFNKIVTNDSRVDNFILPVRDGLMICRVV